MNSTALAGAAGAWIGRLAAPLFVLLWSTGFIGAKYGLPYAEPLTFLSLRFALVVGVLWLGALLLSAERAPAALWPRIALVGALMHGGYLGGVFCAIHLGLSAGMAALITSLSPIVAAAIGRWRFGERLTTKQVIGMALGVGGVALAVGRRTEASWADAPAIALCLFAAAAMAAGAVEQRALKESATGTPPPLAGNLIQYLAALVVCGLLALVIEERAVEWSVDFALALVWLALVLSIGAISLFYYLLRRGAAAEATSLVFLTPPSTAIIAWAMFGETLGVGAVAGFAVAALGVALTTKAL